MPKVAASQERVYPQKTTTVLHLRNTQGFHKIWKSWKTEKITKKSSMHGKIMEFEKQQLNNHGKIMEFCEII